MITLDALLKGLRAGKSPTKLGGRWLGSGCYKVAYKVGDYVVKRRRAVYEDTEDGESFEPWKRNGFPKCLREAGFKPADEWIEGPWTVQLYYSRRFTKWQRNYIDSFLDSPWDIKTDNVGRIGCQLIAFDW